MRAHPFYRTDEDSGEHEVPADLLELHEVLEWEKAVVVAEAEAAEDDE